MNFWDYLSAHSVGWSVFVSGLCLTAIVCCALIADGLAGRSKKS